MIVCICKGLTDTEIESQSAGAETVEALGRKCGAGTDCGSCRDVLKMYLRPNAERPLGGCHTLTTPDIEKEPVYA